MSKFIFIILFIFISLRVHGQSIDSTNLPLVVIDTKGQQIIDDIKITASMKIINNGLNKMNHPADSGNVYNGFIGIEIRGRYSASLPQKPYGIETRDSAGENLNVKLLDMPKENDWILLANYNDKSFVRNALAFKLFRDMGHWAPRTSLCEVIINNSYLGIYNLTEKIKIDDDRINIDKLTNLQNSGDELTGGYVFAIDYYDGTNSWRGNYAPLGYANKEVYFVYNFPKPSEITWQQKSYIQNYVNNFEKNLYSVNYKNPDLGYRSYIDVQSFIDYFIVSEVSRNVDAYKKSCFYYKSRDSKGGKLSAGPVWDFDWAWKNIWDCSMFAATDGSGWAYRVLECDIWPIPTGWMPRLMNDPAFVDELRQRYTALRKNILSNSALMNYIDSVNLLVDKAQVRHYYKWNILGENVGAPEVDDIPLTFSGETQKFKNWITTRLAWLDNQLLITSSPNVENLFGSSANMVIYPNPASKKLIINCDNEIQSLIITNLTGQELVIKNNICNKEIQLNVEQLNAGFYVAKVSFFDGKSQTGIFMIE